MDVEELVTTIGVQLIAKIPLICGSKKIIGDPFMK